jgi:DUF1016 N-terminal domain
MTEPSHTSLWALPLGALVEYQAWQGTIKQCIVSVRLRMALTGSRELIQFYLDPGALIAQNQAQSQWGDRLIAQLSADLQKTFANRGKDRQRVFGVAATATAGGARE